MVRRIFMGRKHELRSLVIIPADCQLAVTGYYLSRKHERPVLTISSAPSSDEIVSFDTQLFQ
jgi:hypothetical protein